MDRLIPICRRCGKEVERDRNGTWLFMDRRSYGRNFSVEYPVYICWAEQDTLHGHDVDLLAQYGVYDLLDIEKGLR